MDLHAVGLTLRGFVMLANAVGVLAREVAGGPEVSCYLGGQPTVSIEDYRPWGWVREIPVYEVHTRNHVAESDPNAFARTTAQVQELIARSESAQVVRSPSPIVGPGAARRVCEMNPAASDLARLAAGYWEPWRELLPSDVAMLPLRAPHATRLPGIESIPLPAERSFLQHTADAIGLRSRDAVMAGLITGWGSPGGAWLSLRCGTALPLLKTAAAASKAVTVDLVDLDSVALSYAAGFAQALGLGERARCTHTDLFALEDLGNKLLLGGARFDVVDMMDVASYLPDEPLDGPPWIPSVGQFLRLAYALTTPGGLILMSNVLASQPQLDFTLKVLQWPYVRPRSLGVVAAQVASAGIDPGSVTIYAPDDGVYAVVAIRVPG